MKLKIKTRTLFRLLLCLAPLFLVFAFWVAATAQSIPGLSKSSSPASSSADSLGRSTPSGTVLGFLEAAQRGSYSTAANYLQMSPTRRLSQGPDLAEKLKILMDRAFVGNIRNLSTSSDGSSDLGTADQQTIGVFSTTDGDAPVVLVRSNDSSFGKIWLFSADTLSKVPELYEVVDAHQVETKLPRVLVQNVFLGVALWQWVGLLIAVPVALLAGWACLLLIAVPRRIWLKYKKQPNFHPYRNLATPLLITISGAVHAAIAKRLGIALLPRIFYYRTIGVVVTVGFFWFVLRLLSLIMRQLRIHSIGAGRTATGTLMVLAERLITAVVATIGVVTVLGILGFNLTTVLAGVGIGGIAIAFAAQKTLENLFGGISVLADEVIRVGDYCRFGDRTGTVEDISLRSTRVRTDGRTELSIPNGALATMSIENFSRRDKILFNPVLAIREETTPDQLRYLLAEVRRLLYEHPKIETSGANIRLANFDVSALRLEVSGYVLTRDADEFAAVREDLLLRIMEIVEKSGSGLALPSQTLYLSRDGGLDKQKTAAAEEQVRQWRDQQKLPFPDFAPADKSAFDNSIVYPPPDSATGKDQTSG